MTINRVIFIGDPWRGDQAANIQKTMRVLSPPLQQFGIEPELFVTSINKVTKREIWVPVWQDALADDCAAAVSALDLENAAVIGFETPERELRYLSNMSVPWINLKIHPLRFLDDLCFDLTSSFPFDESRIAVPACAISFFVQRLSIRYAGMRNLHRGKTLLICGQDWIDRSIYFDGSFRRLSDYLNELDSIVATNDRVLYKPHPAFHALDMAELLSSRYRVELCTDRNFYELLLTENIGTVTAISSSVLTEAPHFGVRSAFLEPRAERYGPAIRYRDLIDHWEFWGSGLLGDAKTSTPAKLSTFVPENYLRKTFGSWGFVTDEMHILSTIAELDSKVQQLHQRSEQAEAQAD
jgi:hypothetical protein